MPASRPDRSLKQRRDALAKANAIRAHRAKLKRDLKAGRTSVLDAIEHPADEVDTMKVGELLLAVPKFGRWKVGKTLNAARISPSKTLGGLSGRQRAELVGLLRTGAGIGVGPIGELVDGRFVRHADPRPAALEDAA